MDISIRPHCHSHICPQSGVNYLWWTVTRPRLRCVSETSQVYLKADCVQKLQRKDERQLICPDSDHNSIEHLLTIQTHHYGVCVFPCYTLSSPHFFQIPNYLARPRILINTHLHTQPASHSHLPSLLLSSACLRPFCISSCLVSRQISLSVCPSTQSSRLPTSPPSSRCLILPSLLTFIPGLSVRLACLTGCEVAAWGFFSAGTEPSAVWELRRRCCRTEPGGWEGARPPYKD